MRRCEPESEVVHRTRRTRTCYLTPLHPGGALSLALVHLLSQEMPDIEFTLLEPTAADAIWVCGPAEEAARRVRRLRARHPEAAILVTARSRAESWKRECLAAGADFARAWPLDYRKLDGLLHRARAEEPEPHPALAARVSGGTGAPSRASPAQSRDPAGAARTPPPSAGWTG